MKGKVREAKLKIPKKKHHEAHGFSQQVRESTMSPCWGGFQTLGSSQRSVRIRLTKNGRSVGCPPGKLSTKSIGMLHHLVNFWDPKSDLPKSDEWFHTKSSHFNRVFHYFNHPFWGTSIFGNTHIKKRPQKSGAKPSCLYHGWHPYPSGFPSTKMDRMDVSAIQISWIWWSEVGESPLEKHFIFAPKAFLQVSQ